MRAAVLTISDGCFHGQREDVSGSALAEILTQNQWDVAIRDVVPDELDPIQEKVRDLSERPGVDLIVTTGGTGLSPRDVTPEAIRPLLEKEATGMAELMRLRGAQITDRAALSRSLAGVRLGTLILALPGSRKGATQSLEAVLSLLPHAVDLIQGRTAHEPSR